MKKIETQTTLAAQTFPLAVKFAGKTHPVATVAQAQDLWDKIRDEAIAKAEGR